MIQRLRAATIALVLLLLTGGCASTGALQVGDEVTLEGTVTAIDAAPMYADGDGVLVMETDEHGVVSVTVPARTSRCAAEGLAAFYVLGVGDRVRAIGTVTAPMVIRACEGREHGLERLTGP